MLLGGVYEGEQPRTLMEVCLLKNKQRTLKQVSP